LLRNVSKCFGSSSMAPEILNVGINGPQWLASGSSHSTSGARALYTLWTGGRVGPNPGPNVMANLKVLATARIEPHPSSLQ